MSTGYAGLKSRKKTFTKVCSPGDTIIYTIPSDVIFATVYLQAVVFTNADSSENTSMVGERFVDGVWQSLGTFGTISLSPIAGTNIDASVFSKFTQGSPVLDDSISNGGNLPSNVSGSISVIKLTSGDRIKATVNSSGETASYTGFILEEYTGKVTVI